MGPTNALIRVLAKASPHLRSRALWAGVFVLTALVRACASPAPPPRSAEGVAAMLGAAAGGEVRPDDFVWEARGGFWGDAILGRRVLFVAARAGSADVYRARVRLTRDGHPLGVGGLHNLSHSPLGDDRDLVAYGHHAAYVTSAFGAVQGVTLLDLSGEGDAREATRWTGRLAAAVESWLTTGSTRGIGRTEITFGAPPPEAREELQGDLLVLALGKEAIPAAVDLRDGTLETGASNTFAAAAQRIPHRAPALGEVAVQAARELLGPTAAGGLRAVLDGLAGRSGSAKQAQADPAPPPPPAAAASDAWPPPSLAPPIQPALAGEGAWAPAIVGPSGEAPPYFYETSIRPDPRHPAALVRLVAIDTRQIDLALAPGIDEPRSAVGLHGSGRLPDGVRAERAVAVLAGGPATRPLRREGEDAGVEPGFVADRRVLVPPSPGLASVAIAADGHALLGVWPGEAQAPFVSVRQTPDAIVGWTGPPKRPLAAEREPVERSALGLTRAGQLVYAWSAAAGAATLGRALELAGCTFAVPLAGDGAPSGLAYLRPPAPEGAPPADRAVPVTTAMSLSPAHLAGRSANDLFYAVLRSAPLPAALAAAGTGGTAFTADGGRQPSPAWLPAVQKADVVSLGAQVHVTMFAPGRVSYRIRPGTKEPAKAVAPLPAALPEGEQARVVAAIGLAAGRKRKARGLIVDGTVGIAFHGDEAGALVVERGRARVVRASEVTPSPGLDATELPLTADDGKLRAEARDVGTMRPRAAACALDDGTLFVATTTFDSDEAATSALLDLGCARVVALDRGAHQSAFVHRAGTEPEPGPRYEASVLYAVEVPLSGRAGPL